jgi:hypothetical protein
MIRAAIANGKTDVKITRFSIDLADFANLDTVDDTIAGDGQSCLEAYYGLQLAE